MTIRQLFPLISSTNPTAAGCLFFARNAATVLLVLRSPDSIEGNTWCGVGGGIEIGETPEEACRREVKEETGYAEPYELSPLYTHEEPGLTFYNFLGVVEEEFEPELNREHTDFLWVRYGEWPHPLHPGFQALISDQYSNSILQEMARSAQVVAQPEAKKRLMLRINKRKIQDQADSRRRALQDQIDNSRMREKAK